MYVPSMYRPPNPAWSVDLIQEYPLALLLTNGPPFGRPFATHVPLIFDPDTGAGPNGELSNRTLLGHMNRTNPHWDALGAHTPVVAVFVGPHGYVSPETYGTTPAAPTWDFTAVHVHGVLDRIAEADETLHVVTSTVRSLESRFGAGWDMTGSTDYFRRILPAVGAFRITVTAMDAMAKLSQEQPWDVRERVRRAFSGSASGSHRELASLIARLKPPHEI